MLKVSMDNVDRLKRSCGDNVHSLAGPLIRMVEAGRIEDFNTGDGRKFYMQILRVMVAPG